MTKSYQQDARDYAYHPEITAFRGEAMLRILEYPCFGQLSRTPGLTSFTYHCHDLLSTKLGSTEMADSFLNDFEEYPVYKHLKEAVSINVDPDHKPHRYSRAINITVDATKITYTEWLLLASILRAFQECPGHIPAYFDVKEILPDKSFLYNWLVANWVDSKKYPTTSFYTMPNGEELSPKQLRLDGHGLVSRINLCRFPEEIDEVKLLGSNLERDQGFLSENRGKETRVWETIEKALHWDSQVPSFKLGYDLPIATKKSINIVLNGGN